MCWFTAMLEVKLGINSHNSGDFCRLCDFFSGRMLLILSYRRYAQAIMQSMQTKVAVRILQRERWIDGISVGAVQRTHQSNSLAALVTVTSSYCIEPSGVVTSHHSFTFWSQLSETQEARLRFGLFVFAVSLPIVLNQGCVIQPHVQTHARVR
jgi:hypothetical protein